MQSALLLVAASVLFTGPRGDTAELKNCLVSLKQKAKVSAQEPGMLVDFIVYEGAAVNAGQWLGRIDDSQAKLQAKAAEAEYRTAEEQANSDVNVRFAKASRNIARTELEQAQSANRQVPGTVSQSEVKRREFALQKAELQIEQSELEQLVQRGTRDKKKAEYEGGKLSVQRRQIKAPFNGVVVEQLKFRGEWVNPGDTIFRVVELDELWVEGFLKAGEFLPSDVIGRPVSVVSQITDRDKAEFTGSVRFVSPEVDPVAGSFRVKAIVKNRRHGAHWLLRPGLRANMVIDLAGPVVPAPELIPAEKTPADSE